MNVTLGHTTACLAQYSVCQRNHLRVGMELSKDFPQVVTFPRWRSYPSISGYLEQGIHLHELFCFPELLFSACCYHFLI